MNKHIIVDGNQAAAKIAYYLSETAAIYPITPSSPMAEYCDSLRAKGVQNAYGNSLQIVQMQSEAGAAGTVHGALCGGHLATTFTSSQGLLLMIPNMYKIAGEMLPCVIHVAARTVATHALSIFGDHSDVMAVRQTGFAMLASSNVQECQDLALVAHMAAIQSSLPFVHFFDGFRSSHELQKICEISTKDIDSILNFDAVRRFKKRALSPNHPTAKGTTQNPDCYFQNLEARQIFYNRLPNIVSDCMDKLASVTGRQYHLCDYFGCQNPSKIVVIMCSGGDTVQETCDFLNKNGESVGVIKIRLYRPFPKQQFLSLIGSSVRYITVLDRTTEFGSGGGPLYLDVLSALTEGGRQDIKVFGGVYGISQKQFTPSMVAAVFDNMTNSGKNHFTVGIEDDVTHTSLRVTRHIQPTDDAVSCLFYGLGSDGTVSANKNSIKIIGEQTDKYVQAYFAYDSKKSGGLTISHLRFSGKPILSSYEADQAEFVACHNPAFMRQYDIAKRTKRGGTFLLNTPLDGAELLESLPLTAQKYIADNDIKFYTIDATSLAQSLGLGGRINTIMQACFFKLANIIDYEAATRYMKDYIAKTFAKKGEKVIKINCDAVDKAAEFLQQVDIKKHCVNASKYSPNLQKSGNEYFDNIAAKVLSGRGDELKVSEFAPDGVTPTATTQYEKRGISQAVASWVSTNCIQCNQCAFVCPHACIRPIMLRQGDARPNSIELIPSVAPKGYEFSLAISPLDCTGCGSCINVCPATPKALEYQPLSTQDTQKENWNFAKAHQNDKQLISSKNVKSSQFAPQLFEFSGACAGCGETPYVKLATSLFGENMIIANATGCSSIYGGSAPTSPFAKCNNGCGAAWANSLFEDNAEFGFGIALAVRQRREKAFEIAEKLVENRYKNEILDNFLAEASSDVADTSAARELAQNLDEMIAAATIDTHKSLLKMLAADKDALSHKSVWVIGGDGWAYDIGFGGLDHILGCGENINILVLDSELYSNTGGQASKATPQGAVAKFAEGGKKTAKKDLAQIAMSYENVYVASVALGANMQQCLTAFREAEQYNGVSLIIAYSPCISHGINMSNCVLEQKLAVRCGYWNLFRFNPQSNNKLQLDSTPIYDEYTQFLLSENRYMSLKRTNPNEFEKLLNENKNQAMQRYAKYTELERMYANPQQKDND